MISAPADLRPMELPPLPETPLVSVLIGNYNYAHFIGQAIDSVLAQSYQRFEICVCDDGSTDRSAEVVLQYAARDPRIRLVCQPNGGAASALNAAWSLAGGDIIGLLDADDAWMPDKIERVLDAFLFEPDAGILVHPSDVVDRNMRVLATRMPARLVSGWHGPAILAGHPPVSPPCSAIVLRREVAARVFPLDPAFRTNADRVIWERAGMLAKRVAVNDSLMLYRIHGDNLTGIGPPADLPGIRKRLAVLEAICRAREEFARRELGIDTSAGSRPENEFAELRLAERLLSGEPPDPALMDQMRAIGHYRQWALLWAVPRPIAARLLRLWWRETKLKQALRRLRDAARGGATAARRP